MSELAAGERASGDRTHERAPEELPKVDVSERGGRGPDGTPQTMDRRLFMQLLVFDCAAETHPTAVVDALATKLRAREVGAVIYADVNAPRGLGLLTYDEDPSVFVEKVRPAIDELGVAQPVQRRDFTMIGRTYSSGYETDLAFWLLDRPKSAVENPAWKWAVWYPLRRSGAFAKLDGREQAAILREHAIIGRAYGTEDLAHDVRLACYGLDPNDNDFVIGLIGKDLHPLSHVVQSMRKTRQTSEYIVQMGPFFVGYAVARTRTAAERSGSAAP
jgi:Chlorite dismutase